MDKAVIWTECKLQNEDREKLELLIDIEDKSYFVRDESYNFCSFEFIKYRFNRQKIKRMKNKVAKRSAK